MVVSNSETCDQLLVADESICNGVVPHPYLPVFASYGIDSDTKIWATRMTSRTLLDHRVLCSTLEKNLRQILETSFSEKPVLDISNFRELVRHLRCPEKIGPDYLPDYPSDLFVLRGRGPTAIELADASYQAMKQGDFHLSRARSEKNDDTLMSSNRRVNFIDEAICALLKAKRYVHASLKLLNSNSESQSSDEDDSNEAEDSDAEPSLSNERDDASDDNDEGCIGSSGTLSCSFHDCTAVDQAISCEASHRTLLSRCNDLLATIQTSLSAAISFKDAPDSSRVATTSKL